MWWIIGGAIWLVLMALVVLFFKGANIANERFEREMEERR